MTERFTYDASAKVFRRKTLTLFQKSLIILLIVANAGLSIYAVSYLAGGEKVSTLLVSVAAIGPTLLTLVFIISIALNPRGPEKDFILPGTGIDPEECSTVTGSIKAADGIVREVECIVPNVYGSSINLLADHTDMGTGSISTPEMYEMAIETIRRKYPECLWESEPSLKDEKP